jgi:peptidoglycan hydrolase-like protein with peptidoglycan-binding domain
MTRKTWALPAAVLLAAVTVTGGVLVLSGSRHQAVAAPPPSVNTATVEKRTLSAMVSQSGILTYRARSDGSPYSVINQARGAYTKLPAVGQVIAEGQVLYRVSDRPVVLLHGATPAYRTLSAGTTGPDVAELNADLVTLRYGTSAQLRPRSAFGPATTAAVQKLQASVGVSRTGTLTLGQAAFAPAAMRVTSVSAQLGGRAQTGETVLEATSTIRQVQVAMPASQQTEVAVGNKVSITLPDNRATPGVVTSVATVATCPSSSGGAGTGSGSAAPGADSCPAAGSGTSTPTIAVDVTFSHPAHSGTWDQAPVQVGITTASVPNALTVPVAALLAQSGGGYAVELAGSGARATNHLVPVSLGLFDDADGLVQVTGSGLTADQKVVVPST